MQAYFCARVIENFLFSGPCRASACIESDRPSMASDRSHRADPLGGQWRTVADGKVFSPNALFSLPYGQSGQGGRHILIRILKGVVDIGDSTCFCAAKRFRAVAMPLLVASRES